jgi:Cof subfamily protein (haloacid dehalogenase superfamily)
LCTLRFVEWVEATTLVVKALIFDIDGTLLTSRGVMTRATYDALLACKQAGLIICVATARSGRIVFRDDEIPGDQAPLLERGIFYNGATVFDHPHHFYQHTPIPGDVVHEMVKVISDYDPGLQIALQYDDLYHSFKYPLPAQELPVWGLAREDVYDFEAAKTKPVTKIMVFKGATWETISGDLSNLYSRLSAEFAPKANLVLADSRKSIYIISRYAGKGHAIRTLIALYGIQLQEVAVFGDDTPDMAMFGQFGHSIAMGNAHDSLKAISTFVTLTNDQDGVVYALKNYLKLI